jgi:hypothetical protein
MSNQTLVESVKTGAAGLAGPALLHYRELLAKGEALNKGDRERLAMAAHVLGKSGDDVERDHTTMQQALSLRASAAQLGELEHMAGVRKDEADKREGANVIEKRRLDELLATAKANATAAEHDAIAARDAQRQLQSLKDANRDLLGAI